MSGIVIGGLAVLALSCIGTVLAGQRRRLEKVEQWERWIVKLQTQIKETEKRRVADRRATLDKQREFERVAANMATVVKYLVPLAQAIHAGTEVATEQAAKAYHPQKREALEPTWEELTSRPAQPFAATGVTIIGIG